MTRDTIALDTRVGDISSDLARRGIAAGARVHVVVQFVGDDDPPLAAIARAGGAFEWLNDEPELYTDADIRNG